MYVWVFYSHFYSQLVEMKRKKSPTTEPTNSTITHMDFFIERSRATNKMNHTIRTWRVSQWNWRDQRHTKKSILSWNPCWWIRWSMFVCACAKTDTHSSIDRLNVSVCVCVVYVTFYSYNFELNTLLFLLSDCSSLSFSCSYTLAVCVNEWVCTWKI